jgi:hypothetical protein
MNIAYARECSRNLKKWNKYDGGLENKPTLYFFCVAQQPHSGLGRLIVDVSSSHTIRHTRPVGLVRTSDQLVVETATHKTHNNIIYIWYVYYIYIIYLIYTM